MAGFAENGGIFPSTVEAVRRTLFEAAPAGTIVPNPAGWTVEFLDCSKPELQSRRRALQPAPARRWLQGTGRVEGHLVGGCLEVLDWLRGTPVWPAQEAWNGTVLFWETSEEAPSPTAVARILRSFGAMGILERLAAMLVGRPGGRVSPADFARYDAAILDVVGELDLPQLPIVTQMDFGHTDPMTVLPYGVHVRVDCEGRTVASVEPAVRERS